MAVGNRDSRPVRWRSGSNGPSGVFAAATLSLMLVYACGQDATTPGPPVVSSPPDAASVSGDSFSADSSSAADTLYGHIAAGSLNPADEPVLTGDTIFRDTVVIGHVLEAEQAQEDNAAGDYNPYGLPPGECWVEIEVEYHVQSGLIRSIKITVVYCVPEEEEESGGGSTEEAATVDLKCPEEAVERGTSATCELDAGSAAASVSDVRWSFSGANADANRDGGMSWGGTAVESGTMTVTANVNGSDTTISKPVTIENRGWKWSLEAGWDAGADPCLPWAEGNGYWGQTVPQPCGAFFNSGDDNHTVGPGTGPWAGVFYVKTRNAPFARVAAMFNPLLTPAGAKHTVTHAALAAACADAGVTGKVNEDLANLKCEDEQGYRDARVDVRTHEDTHLEDIDDIVKNMDVYVAWDTIVGGSAVYVSTVAKAAATAAAQEIESRAWALDSQRYPGWIFWLYKNNQWSYGRHSDPK